MKKMITAAIGALAMSAGVAGAVDGLMTVSSTHSVAATTDRLEKALEAAGFRIFARVDHGAGAKSVDMPLSPSELLIIGKLYSTAKGYELFLKLLRVETGEVLSVTKAIIDTALGLEA